MSKLNEKKMLDEMRMLSLDMINEASCGYPGSVLAAAPIFYSLFTNHLVYDTVKSDWMNRDRFVLSDAKLSPLLYTSLYMTTEDYTMDDLKNYRVLHSITPGIPELNVERRIELTTGKPGEGLGIAVGMAMSGKYLASKYSSKKVDLFDYKVYAMCSDEDFMEGSSYESAMLAGEYNLDNLVVLYNASGISADGALPKDYSEKVANTYASLGWDVFVVKSGEKISEIDKAIESAVRSKLPSMVIVNTTFGKYSNYENSNKIYAKIDSDDLEEIRTKLNLSGRFTMDEANLEAYRKVIRTRNQQAYNDWYHDYETYTSTATEKEVQELNDYINDEDIILNLNKVIDSEKLFLDKPMCDINFQIMNVISAFINKFMGGTAGVANQTKAYLKNGEDYKEDNYTGKNISFGNRENALGLILNGMALCHFRVFGAAYLTSADNMKSAIRSSAIMNLPITYIFTHDSIKTEFLGKSEAPIEQISMLRSIPNLNVYRPCDYKELIGVWQIALKEKKPTAIIVSKLPTESYKFTSVDEVALGGYVISEVKSRLDVMLIASGAEVTLAMKLKKELLKSFIEARIISMPSIDEFMKQPKEYQNQVLPKGYKRMIIELSSDKSLHRLVRNEEDIIGINSYSKSASADELINEYELDIPSIVIRIKNNI